MAASQDFYDTGPGPVSDCDMAWHGGPAPVDGVEIYANGGGVVGYKTLLMIDLNTMTTIVAVSPNGFAFEHQQDDILRWAFGD